MINFQWLQIGQKIRYLQERDESSIYFFDDLKLAQLMIMHERNKLFYEKETA